jgi:hypothetical protein
MKFWIEAKRMIGEVTKIVTCNTLVVTRDAPTLLCFPDLTHREKC